jgi:hydrogenase-4 component F
MLAYSSIENMGVLIIGAALGGIALIASMIHLVGHSLVKASFFLTSGNILELYGTKKIKSVTGLLKTDKTTGWLWILSFVGIAALPPSLLFISEFMIIKTFIEQNKIFLCIVFLILLTIVLYGLAKAVLRMAFSSPSEEIQPKKLSWTMYAPQIVMLLFVFICCLSCPTQIVKLITIAVG